MNKRAVIYIRTSSEHQGEKSSPIEQEEDCRKLALENNLEVVSVYRDIEKFRVGSRLVEPSGTRYDRPGFLAMIRDAKRGKFDVILAWKEDRLYRGMRAMLLVLETIQEYQISILLAKENFDPKIAPLRAWIAQMELDGMKERMDMGVKARLKAGKANTGQDRYGYVRVDDVIEVVQEEAFWVRKIFEWYVAKVSIMEIRQRLIEANAPQKGSSRPRKVQWAKSSIQAVLMAAEEYAFGIKRQSRKGEVFEIPVEPIISTATYEQFMEIRKKNKTHPKRHQKTDYLIGGLLYCDCERKWGARTNKIRKNRKGEIVRRPTPIGVYFCPQRHKELVAETCPRTINTLKADAIVWDKVYTAINKPEYLLGQASRFVEEIKAKTLTVEEDEARIRQELEALIEERQWLITQARKGYLTATDMDQQLNSMSMIELELKRELAAIGQVINIELLDQWEAKVKEYLQDIQAGIEALNDAAPQNKEEQQEVFRLKKEIVDTLVEKVTIDQDRTLHVHIRLNLLRILEEDANKGGPNAPAVSIQSGGTYTRKPASRARRHLHGVCASPFLQAFRCSHLLHQHRSVVLLPADPH